MKRLLLVLQGIDKTNETSYRFDNITKYSKLYKQCAQASILDDVATEIAVNISVIE